jgi:hypothetical protein
MIRAISTTVLIAYLFSGFGGYYPIVDYLINKDYIAEHYCVNKDKPEMECDGKCYLIKQLHQASEDHEKPTSVVSLKEEITHRLFVHEYRQWAQPRLAENSIGDIIYTFPLHADPYIEAPTPPPKYSHC